MRVIARMLWVLGLLAVLAPAAAQSRMQRGKLQQVQDAYAASIRWGDFGPSIPELNDVVAEALGGSHALTLKADGTVIGWGNGDAITEATIPAGLTNVVAVAAGWGCSLALREDGSIVAWGRGSSGETNLPPK